jgi:hypothetical protein
MDLCICMEFGYTQHTRAWIIQQVFYVFSVQ